MKTIDVVFEVPVQIQQGMMSGSLERVGGIVRDSETKQVVAWLRDGSAIDPTNNPVDQILSASRGQNLLLLTGRSALLLNLTLMAIGIFRINQQLKTINDEISSIKDEFRRDRLVKKRVALRAARDVLTAQDERIANNRFNSAQDGLYEAQHQLLHDIEEAIEVSAKITALAEAMQMLSLRVRCYLRLGQRDLALLDFNKDAQAFETQTHHIIGQLIGAHPAIFLHTSLPDASVDRFIDLQLWLRDQRLTTASYGELLHEMRHDFWNTQALSLLDNRKTFERVQDLIPRQLRAQKADTPSSSPLEERLQLAEIARENLARLQGFELEIREERLVGIAQWEVPLQSEDMSPQALIIDREVLENLAG